MRAAVFHGPRDIRLSEVPDPTPEPGQLPPREAPVTRATFPSRRPLMRGPDYPLTEPAVRPLT